MGSTARTILGIDPGSFHLGVGLIEEEGQSLRRVWSHRFDFPESMPKAERLSRIFHTANDIGLKYRPCGAALESGFMHNNSKTTQALSEVRGAVLAGLGGAGLKIVEINPSTVKRCATGNGKADKSVVKGCIVSILNIKVGLTDDESDALAVGLAGLSRI